jgi:C1A family cysteine protease
MFALLLCLAVVNAFHPDFPLQERFNEWASEFRVSFDSDQHYRTVYNNWELNHKYIEFVNNDNRTYTLGHNQFSGMSDEEYTTFLNTDLMNRGVELASFDGSKIDKVKEGLDEAKCLYGCAKNHKNVKKIETLKCTVDCLDMDVSSLDEVSSSLDWVEKGAVTGVKDQGQCGSCWSFSTTGALEGAYFNKYGKLVSFSEQELVDCDNFKNGGRDHGCNGGLMDNAFKWIKGNGGLCTESTYPYISGTTKTAGDCKTECTLVDNSRITSFVDVPTSSDTAMMEALQVNPISVAIQADQKDFQLYKSGVFNGDCGTKLDHGVLLVGYGSKDGSDYYRIKNSWGTTWGDDGYIYFGRGSEFNNGDGQCGVLLQGSYPVL